MKFLITSSYYHPAVRFGGPAYAVSQLAVALRQHGAEVRVLTTTADVDGHLDVRASRWTDHLGVPTWYAPAEGYPRRTPSSFNYSPEFRRRVEEFAVGADVMLGQGTFTHATFSTAQAARKTGVPNVIFPHGALGKWSLGQKCLKKSLYWNLVEKHGFQSAAGLIFTSDMERYEAGELKLKPLAFVVPNCAAIDAFRPEQVDTWRKQLTRSSEDRIVLFCGRLHPVKGIDVLLNAFAQLRNSHFTARLVIAGSGLGKFENEYRELATSLDLKDSIAFLGTVTGTSKAALFSAADVLCLPSRHENFGIVVAEAMLAGTPVVVNSAVGICPDVIESDCGLIADLNPTSISDCIRRLLSESPERLNARGASGKEFATNAYSAEAVASGIVDAVEKILSTRIESVNKRRRVMVA